MDPGEAQAGPGAGETLETAEGVTEHELAEVLSGGLGAAGSAEGEAQRGVGEGEGKGNGSLAAQPVAERDVRGAEQANEQRERQAEHEALVDPRGEQAGGEDRDTAGGEGHGEQSEGEQGVIVPEPAHGGEERRGGARGEAEAEDGRRGGGGGEAAAEDGESGDQGEASHVGEPERHPIRQPQHPRHRGHQQPPAHDLVVAVRHLVPEVPRLPRHVVAPLRMSVPDRAPDRVLGGGLAGVGRGHFAQFRRERDPVG